MSNQLSVRLHGFPLGELGQDDHGRMWFRYLPAAGRSLSLCLPVREEPYDHRACEAYFGGLLPEGELARKAIARRYGANARNSFSLLRAIGYDCAGAVSLHAPSDPVAPAEHFMLKARPMPEAELAAHIRDLPRKPLFMGAEGMRLSLAGAQDKAAVCLVEGQPALPLEGTPTTHILKPGIEHLEDTVLNEYVCMTLAKTVGLDVPAVEMREAEGIPYLLVERYDRRLRNDGQLIRIHQEDFCQALGVPAAMKYQADGGPSLEDCFSLTLRFSAPAVARTQLLKRIVFNVLVGNGDAHAKNFSIIHSGDGRVSLSPAYDIVCTRLYSDLADKMAMKIGGCYRVGEIYARHWRRFCEETDLGFPLLKRTIQGMSESLLKAIQGERTAASPKARIILDIIERHTETVVHRFNLV